MYQLINRCFIVSKGQLSPLYNGEGPSEGGVRNSWIYKTAEKLYEGKEWGLIEMSEDYYYVIKACCMTNAKERIDAPGAVQLLEKVKESSEYK